VKGILACLLAASVLNAQDSIGQVSTVILPKGLKVIRAWHHDLSADGLPDLIIAATQEDERYARSLRIYHDQGESAMAPFV